MSIDQREKGGIDGDQREKGGIDGDQREKGGIDGDQRGKRRNWWRSKGEKEE